jgi:hypothetical protein
MLGNEPCLYCGRPVGRDEGRHWVVYSYRPGVPARDFSVHRRCWAPWVWAWRVPLHG